MSSSLTQNYNSDYIEASNVLTNRRGRIKVLVEDENDIPFWSDVLSVDSNLQFECTPYYSESNENRAKGKPCLLKFHQNLGTSLICCLDSDYDYLLPELTDNARIVNSSPYILQTGVYSVENYNCYAPTLRGVCEKATTQSSEYNFEPFLKNYSEIIFPLFIWTLLLEVKEDSTDTEISGSAKVGQYLTCTSNISVEEILDEIRSRIASKVTYLESTYPTYVEEVEHLRTTLIGKELQANNAYLFIRGHNLYSFVVNKLIKPHVKFISKAQISSINNSSLSREEKNEELKQLKARQNDINIVINNNFEYKSSCPIYLNFLKPSIDELLNSINEAISR